MKRKCKKRGGERRKIRGWDREQKRTRIWQDGGRRVKSDDTGGFVWQSFGDLVIRGKRQQQASDQ